MNAALENEKPLRRNIEIYPETAKRMKWLRRRMEASSDTEVVRRALRILEELIKDEDRGCKHYLKESSGDMIAVRVL